VKIPVTNLQPDDLDTARAFAGRLAERVVVEKQRV